MTYGPMVMIRLCCYVLSILSGVLVQSAAVSEAQPRCDPLHPDPLPMAVGHHQPHLPTGRPDAPGSDRSTINHQFDQMLPLLLAQKHTTGVPSLCWQIAPY